MHDWTISDEERALFDRLLEEVLAELPDEYHEMLEEVPLVVDDEPSVELQKEMKAYAEGEPSDICGVHSGPSISSAARNELPTAGALIQLFRGPLLRLADAREKRLRKEIRITLLHELGHYFDFSEEELAERGYD